MTLEELKEQHAKERGFDNWKANRDFLNTFNVSVMEGVISEIATRYAKAKLEEAAERAMLKKEDIDGIYKRYFSPHEEDPIVVCKKSITETPLD